MSLMTWFPCIQVNGDRVTWMVDEFDDMLPLTVNKAEIGHTLSTKAVGSNTREDITHLYKHEEGGLPKPMRNDQIAVDKCWIRFSG